MEHTQIDVPVDGHTQMVFKGIQKEPANLGLPVLTHRKIYAFWLEVAPPPRLEGAVPSGSASVPRLVGRTSAACGAVGA